MLAKVNAAVEARIGSDMLARLQADTSTTIINGETWARFDVAAPAPLLPTKGFTMGINDRTFSLVGGVSGTQRILPISFDLSSVIYAWTAAAYNTAGATFPAVGFANALDTFTAQFKLSQGRQYQTEPTLGSAIFGDAKRPRYLGMPCMRMPPGTLLQLLLTPLSANLRIDVTLYCIELTPFEGNVA